MCDNPQWLIAHAFNLLIVPGKKKRAFHAHMKGKERSRHSESFWTWNYNQIFFDPKITNEFCPWRRETLYGAPCMASWSGEEGPHEGRASYQVAMSPRLPRDSGTLCLRTKWQAIVRAGAQQWYLWYLRQPGLQISTELVIKEERAHVEWKPSQWSCCWVGRDVSQVQSFQSLLFTSCIVCQNLSTVC